MNPGVWAHVAGAVVVQRWETAVLGLVMACGDGAGAGTPGDDSGPSEGTAGTSPSDASVTIPTSDGDSSGGGSEDPETATAGTETSTGDDTGTQGDSTTGTLDGWCLHRTELGLAPQPISDRARLVPIDGGYLWYHGGSFEPNPDLLYYDARARFVDGKFSVDLEAFVSNSSAHQTAFYADFDGDGLMDSLRALQSNMVDAVLRLGEPDPAVFGPVAPLDFGQGSEQLIALADYDDDGSTDLLYYDWTSDAVEVWLSDGGLTVEPDWSGWAPDGPVGYVYGVSGQTDPRLAAAGYGPSGNYLGQVVVYRAENGAVSIVSQSDLGVTGIPFDVRDNNGDGQPDVFVARATELFYLQSNGLGILEDTGFVAARARAFVRDFDQDGDADVLYWDADGAGFVVENLSGTFAPPFPIPDPSPVAHAAFGNGYAFADVDGDGTEEVVYGESVDGGYLNVIVHVERC